MNVGREGLVRDAYGSLEVKFDEHPAEAFHEAMVLEAPRGAPKRRL